MSADAAHGAAPSKRVVGELHVLPGRGTNFHKLHDLILMHGNYPSCYYLDPHSPATLRWNPAAGAWAMTCAWQPARREYLLMQRIATCEPATALPMLHLPPCTLERSRVYTIACERQRWLLHLP